MEVECMYVFFIQNPQVLLLLSWIYTVSLHRLAETKKQTNRNIKKIFILIKVRM